MDLKAKIREVPDWPQPGVGFKDVTPLLADTRSLLLTGVAATPILSALILLVASLLLVASWFYARIVLWVAMEQVNE